MHTISRVCQSLTLEILYIQVSHMDNPQKGRKGVKNRKKNDAEGEGEGNKPV